MDDSATRRLALRGVGIAGAALFAFFFSLTFHQPRWVEDFAADYLERQALLKVEHSINDLRPPTGGDLLSRYAAKLYAENQKSIDDTKKLLVAKAAEQLLDCIDRARALSDPQRRALVEWLQHGATLSIGSLTLENSKLATLIQSGYLAVVEDLKRDLRIFAASNTMLFMLLVLVSFLKPDLARALSVPAALLTVSTLTCAYLYVFEQNWLLTIVRANYLGFAYDGYLAVAFGFVCDVWFNKARVTLRILEGLSGAVGSITPF
jgi:hypothetical protein